MKRFIVMALFLCGSCISYAQVPATAFIDSLNQLLNKSPEDTNRVRLLLRKAEAYFFTKPDSTRVICEEALQLARKLNFLSGQVNALNNVAEAYRFTGDYPLALKMNFEALRLNKQMKDLNGEAISLGYIGFDYVEFREYRQGLDYLLASYKLNKNVRNQLKEAFDLTNIAHAYNLLNKPDSGLYFSQLSIKAYTGLTHGPLRSLILTRMGNAFSALGRKDSAMKYYRMGLENSMRVNEKVNLSKIQQRMANLFEEDHQYDSSLYYARQSFLSGQQAAQRLELLVTSELLARVFTTTKSIDSAFFYLDFAKKMTDSLYGPEKFKALQLLMLDEQERQQQIEQDQERFKTRARMIALWSAVGIFLIIAFILYRNNLHKQKANKLLLLQKQKVEDTLSELKATQQQLIQSEKMASMGELTAGIAHEIQNPLNFVNNFSEVSNEMIDELNEELDKNAITEAKAISNDIKQNLEKINRHGKRADAIVKGMLQHSRQSTGKKEPTDINALCDEYLRLAYHGLRAKDKSSNAKFETDFDPSLTKINVVPQDIGRVVLNLINNAFYTVNEKAKQNVAGDEPTVTVSTKKDNGKVIISVKDNGNGIPDSIKEKIFQPFFTTKPTGSGTGLGLSLSYDIMKAHGGEINVNSKDGQGTEFIIALNQNP